jgi:hypothetical protein
MHEDPVLVLPEAGVDRLAGEGPGQEGLAGLDPVDDLLQLPTAVGIAGPGGLLPGRDRLDQLSQGGEVVQGVEADRLVPPRRIALRPAALFRRTGVGAVDAHRVRSAQVQFQTIFHPDLMPPEIRNVVVVGELGTRAEPEVIQRHPRRGDAEIE